MSPSILRDVLLGYEGKGNVGLVGGFEAKSLDRHTAIELKRGEQSANGFPQRIRLQDRPFACTQRLLV